MGSARILRAYAGGFCPASLSIAPRRVDMRGKSARYPIASVLRGQFDRVFVPENSHRLLQLLGLERLFQNRDRPLRQNAIEHFAIGVTSNDNDGTIGLFPLNEICTRHRQDHREV